MIELPSKLFYDNELQAHAKIMEREGMCTWKHLVKPGIPMIFHGIAGKDERESNSPSWFNADESLLVKQYVMKLLQDSPRGLAIKETDIGIIAPYRKQVLKIKSILKKFPGVEIGSVEQFQGQEKRIIIISTVRSSPEFIQDDKKFNIG